VVSTGVDGVAVGLVVEVGVRVGIGVGIVVGDAVPEKIGSGVIRYNEKALASSEGFDGSCSLWSRSRDELNLPVNVEEVLPVWNVYPQGPLLKTSGLDGISPCVQIFHPPNRRPTGSSSSGRSCRVPK